MLEIEMRLCQTPVADHVDRDVDFRKAQALNRRLTISTIRC